MTASCNVRAVLALVVYLLLLCQSDPLFADERLTLYDRNKRNLQSGRSSSYSNQYSGGESQRQYYGGRDYFCPDCSSQPRPRTIGRPNVPWQ